MVKDAEKASLTVGGIKVAVIEAGTGTGKSFGYLAPSIAGAIAAKKKLVISTGTVALQHQLWSRDIPAILKANNLSLKMALAKGRSRYACSLKLRQIASGAESSATAARMAARFARNEWRGDLDEWPSQVDPKTRQEVVETGPGCLRSKCPNFEECAAFKAREEAAEADIVVSNHALTILSLSSAQGGPIGINPEESIIVFDEAHHIDSVLKESQSLEFNISATSKWLNQAGLKVAALFESVNAAASGATILDAPEWRSSASQLSFLSDRVAELDYGRAGEGAVHRFKNAAIHQGLSAGLKKFSDIATVLAIKIDRAAEQVRARVDAHPATASQIKATIDRLYSLAGAAEALAKPGGNDAPKGLWVERSSDRDGAAFIFKQKPLDVSRQMQSILWDKAHSVILASATITALGEFEDFARRTGLAARNDVIYKKLGSPFNYESQGEINLFPMQAEPVGKDAKEFEQEVISELPGLIRQTRSTLVLFTSRGMMQRALKAMPSELTKNILCQDDFGKRELIDRHKIAINAGAHSAIFGLASLAEGLDLPGKYLEHVVITKLQFGSPEDPVFQAHSEYLQGLNRNPFAELALPDASTKLVQAVGRLIRTAEDIGRVTIMDKRIMTKRYGKQLLDALPPLPVVSTRAPVDLARFGGASSTAKIAAPVAPKAPPASCNEILENGHVAVFNDQPPFIEAIPPMGRRGAASTAGLMPPSIFDAPDVEPKVNNPTPQKAAAEIMLPPTLI